MKLFRALIIAVLIASSAGFAEEPALPAGLTDEDSNSSEPALPAGLGSDEPTLPSGLNSDEPSLPAGLDAGEPILADGVISDVDNSASASSESELPFNLNGFWDNRLGARIHDDPDQKRASIGESRLQFSADKQWDSVSARITSDFVFDPVMDEYRIDLDTGDGFIDLREAFLQGSPVDFLDIKLGRQILTWGTGDYVFINDLFPKDWNSFFIGRSDDYLKAPSDTLTLGLFSEIANLDLIYAPNMDADRFIDGRRISYYNPFAGEVVGRSMPIDAKRRNRYFTDDEFHARLYGNLSSAELALYGYYGFWKTPEAVDTASMRNYYPELAVYGASVRNPLFGGIGNIELGYYDSLDDRSGSDPFVRNSEWRFLAGFEREIIPELTGGFQYYLEYMDDYSEYEKTLPPGMPKRDEARHLLTLRLTQLLMNQNLTLSLFAFYSPSDKDSFSKLKANYKFTDAWYGEIGANLFFGEKNYTFFGQFEDASNVYVAARYSFSAN